MRTQQTRLQPQKGNRFSKMVSGYGLAIGASLGLSIQGLAADSCCSYLPPNRPCIKGDLPDQSNAYAQFSFLYWECGEKGLDYALKNSHSQENSILSVYQPSFKWDPAFRFVLGYHLPQDDWKIDFSYSIFYQDQDNHVDAAVDNLGEGLLSVWTSPGAFYSQNLFVRWLNASAKWKIHAHFFDLMLRHDLWNGKALSFQPACGLKMALLQQRYVLRFFPGNSTSIQSFTKSTINMNNRSLNIGPSVGCGSEWCMNPNWMLFGSLSGALLGSHFHVGRNEYDLSTLNRADTIYSYRNTDEYWTYRPQGSLIFGLRWADCSCSKKRVLHYAVSASYEAQYWWKQNMMLRNYDAPIVQSTTMAPTQGDLFFHGLTVDLLFDF